MPEKIKHKKSAPDDLIIDANDFKSMQICISVENTTARTEVKNFDVIPAPKGSKKDKPYKAKTNDFVQLIEIQEQGFVLQLPPNSCSTGHNLTVLIEVVNGPKNVEFQTTAKVKEIEKMEDAQWATVQFIQYKEDDWTKFNKVYSSRQDDILNFFESVKG